jgi:hypothetical protein
MHQVHGIPPGVPVVAKFAELIKWGIACIDGPCVPVGCQATARLNVSPPPDAFGRFCAPSGRQVVTVDGSGSARTDGGPLGYRWVLERLVPPGCRTRSARTA